MLKLDSHSQNIRSDSSEIKRIVTRAILVGSEDTPKFQFCIVDRDNGPGVIPRIDWIEHGATGNWSTQKLVHVGGGLDRVSVPSPIAIDILMDTMARDRVHMYPFSV